MTIVLHKPDGSEVTVMIDDYGAVRIDGAAYQSLAYPPEDLFHFACSLG